MEKARTPHFSFMLSLSHHVLLVIDGSTLRICMIFTVKGFSRQTTQGFIEASAMQTVGWYYCLDDISTQGIVDPSMFASFRMVATPLKGSPSCMIQASHPLYFAIYTHIGTYAWSDHVLDQEDTHLIPEAVLPSWGFVLKQRKQLDEKVRRFLAREFAIEDEVAQSFPAHTLIEVCHPFIVHNAYSRVVHAH